jgi:hypothetical protein
MQRNEDDILEVLIFDLIEETVGTRLRAIIQCLEEYRSAVRRGRYRQLTRSRRNVGFHHGHSHRP